MSKTNGNGTKRAEKPATKPRPGVAVAPKNLSTREQLQQMRKLAKALQSDAEYWARDRFGCSPEELSEQAAGVVLDDLMTTLRVVAAADPKPPARQRPARFPETIEELRTLPGGDGTCWHLVKMLLELLDEGALTEGQETTAAELVSCFLGGLEPLYRELGRLFDAYHIYHAPCFLKAANALLDGIDDFHTQHFVRARLRGDTHVLDALEAYFSDRHARRRPTRKTSEAGGTEWGWYGHDGFGSVFQSG